MTWIPLAFECLPPEISLLGPPAATRRTISSSWRSDIFPATPGRRFAKSIVARCPILPAGKFGPEDTDLIWGVETEPHPVPFNLDHGEGDAVADDDLLAGLPAQN